MAETKDLAQPMHLVIARSEFAAAEIRLFELRREDGGDLPEFTPGAHLHVQVPNGASRRYSLCNDPAERERYVIAVKREATGRGGSISLVDDARDGDRLTITALRNEFALVGNPASYIFIAGGIGITPILSMIHHLESGGKPFKLYYMTRSAELTAFRAELSAPEYRGKVFVHHDNGDRAQGFDLWPVLEQPRGAHVYCCGPRKLMEAVRDMTGHWSAVAVHFEDFGAGANASSAGDTEFTVRLARSGATYVVPAGTSILEILRRNGHNIASSCEAGSCGTCRTRLLGGEADHRDLVLAEHERGDEIMVCVSRARSGELILDL